ncbi:MAG TPA: tRNA (N6-threonylcarbamoyladenosine(37)-N6)-methyltransferase TrmO [Nocardioides sp.]|nr:tRNA (N6-threonylcarbamoyladenosine(37)-N6)-methyltransferase TrmO [Nocardioides sp.]
MDPEMPARYTLRPIGTVQSAISDPAEAPRQGDEGAPDTWITLSPGTADGARDLVPGDDVLVLTWLHLADRAVLAVHPRDDVSRPLTGVFSTRSSDRPNPIGLHRVQILATEDQRIGVRGLEAVDGTPVLDIKPVLEVLEER